MNRLIVSTGLYLSVSLIPEALFGPWVLSCIWMEPVCGGANTRALAKQCIGILQDIKYVQAHIPHCFWSESSWTHPIKITDKRTSTAVLIEVEGEKEVDKKNAFNQMFLKEWFSRMPVWHQAIFVCTTGSTVYRAQCVQRVLLFGQKYRSDGLMNTIKQSNLWSSMWRNVAFVTCPSLPSQHVKVRLHIH